MFTLRLVVIVIVIINVCFDINIDNLIPQHPRHIGDM